MKYIFAHLRPFYRMMSIGLVIKIAGSLMDLVLPYILAYLIDDVVPGKDLTAIVIWGGVMIVCALFGMIGNVIANRMASAVARDSTKSLREALFEKITSLSSAQVDEITVPSLESRITSDTYHIHQMVGSMQRLGVRAPILLIGGIIVTALFEPVLTLVIVAVLPLMILAIWQISKRSVPLYQSVQKASDGMVRVVRENAQGIRVVKALSRVPYEIKRFAGVKDELIQNETKAGIVTATSGPLMSFFLYLGQTAVIVVGAIRVASGQTEAGKIIAFLSYFTIILNAMLAISRMFVMLSKGIASANRVAEIMEYPTDLHLLPQEEREEEEGSKDKPSPIISFESVSFAYANETAALSDISFTLHAGQSLGIIGATGSGKSTVIRLLMRFYDPQAGKIKIRGKDIRSIPPKQLYACFGAALQNDTVFALPLSENIDLWRGLDQEAIKEAAVNAQADAFISAKEEGYDTKATVKGANLSGGQRQRLMIARAIASKPPILIFDDSSSALDYKTDADLRTALSTTMPKDTCRIIVAQRISAVMDCTEILVLDHGNILARGTHEALLASCQLYREISESQMGGEILE